MLEEKLKATLEAAMGTLFRISLDLVIIPRMFKNELRQRPPVMKKGSRPLTSNKMSRTVLHPLPRRKQEQVAFLLILTYSNSHHQ